MDVWAAKFNQSQIALATGVQRNRMAMWFTKGYIRYAEKDGDANTGNGVAHQVSARTALRVALTDLLSSFIDAGRAADAIGKFMDSSETPDRMPGELFPDGETVLIVYDDGKATVRRIAGDTLAIDLPPLRDGRRCALFPLNDTHATVLRRLEGFISPAFPVRDPSSVAIKRRSTAKIDA